MEKTVITCDACGNDLGDGFNKAERIEIAVLDSGGQPLTAVQIDLCAECERRGLGGDSHTPAADNARAAGDLFLRAVRGAA